MAGPNLVGLNWLEMALDFTKLKLRQRDGVTCGPSAAIVAAAMLNPEYAAQLEQTGWFEAEQEQLHRRLNVVWPRALGTTPMGMVSALSAHSKARGVRYRWRTAAGPRDRLRDVREAVHQGWPVAMLIGKGIPRHWVLLVGWSGQRLQVYEPGAGDVLLVAPAELRGGLGFPQVFGYVLPAL